MALPRRLRRVALIWWWSSLPLFVAGFATAWAGVVTDNLSVMLSGLAICVPFMAGLYVAVGGFFVWGLVVLARILPELPGVLVRQYRENRPRDTGEV